MIDNEGNRSGTDSESRALRPASRIDESLEIITPAQAASQRCSPEPIILLDRNFNHFKIVNEELTSVKHQEIEAKNNK